MRKELSKLQLSGFSAVYRGSMFSDEYAIEQRFIDSCWPDSVARLHARTEHQGQSLSRNSRTTISCS